MEFGVYLISNCKQILARDDLLTMQAHHPSASSKLLSILPQSQPQFSRLARRYMILAFRHLDK